MSIKANKEERILEILESRAKRSKANADYDLKISLYCKDYGPGEFILPNVDRTWTRITIKDNIKGLSQEETIWKSVALQRYSVDVRILKNRPKG